MTGVTHDLPVVTVVEVALAAVFDHRDVRLRDRNLCAGELLEIRECAGVISGRDVQGSIVRVVARWHNAAVQ